MQAARPFRIADQRRQGQTAINIHLKPLRPFSPDRNPTHFQGVRTDAVWRGWDECSGQGEFLSVEASHGKSSRENKLVKVNL